MWGTRFGVYIMVSNWDTSLILYTTLSESRSFLFEQLGHLGRTWYVVHGSSSAQTSPPKLDGLLFVKPTVTDPFQWLIGTQVMREKP